MFKLFEKILCSTVPECTSSATFIVGINTYFIALIHPIQWTIALPVAMTVLPNARKRCPVYTTGRTSHGVCIRHSFASAIADKLGNFPINVSKDENLARLLDSFHRDRPNVLYILPAGPVTECVFAIHSHQPLLTSWATSPLMSAKMRISPVSWIVSTETDPRAGGAFPPGTFPWFCTS